MQTEREGGRKRGGEKEYEHTKRRETLLHGDLKWVLSGCKF